MGRLVVVVVVGGGLMFTPPSALTPRLCSRPAAGARRAAEAAGPGQEAVPQRRRQRAVPLVLLVPAWFAHPAPHPPRQEDRGQSLLQSGRRRRQQHAIQTRGLGGSLLYAAALRQQRSVCVGVGLKPDFR